MGKQKTHQGARKRLKTTATGRLRRGRQLGGHLRQKKRPKRRRALDAVVGVHGADRARLARLLPYRER